MKPFEPRGWSVYWHSGDQRWQLKVKVGSVWKQRSLDPSIRKFETKKAETAGEEVAIQMLAAAGTGGALEKPRRAKDGALVKEKTGPWLDLRSRMVGLGELAPATLHNNKQHVKTWIEPLLGQRPVDALSVAELRAWVRGLADKRAAITVRNVVATLRLFLDDCIAEGWCKRRDNPARDLGNATEMAAQTSLT